MYTDREWGDNFKIVEGNILHEKVNDPFFDEKRGDRHISRSVPVFSEQLKLYGIADIVEFFSDAQGVSVEGKPGKWRINPVEYKNGKPEKSNADYMQLCAVGMCLEEMFSAHIASGDMYYGKLRRRVKVEFNAEIRTKVKQNLAAINELLETAAIPARPENQNCNLCSLLDICIPSIFDVKESNQTRMEKLLKR